MNLAFWTAWRSLRSRLGAVLITLLAVSLATATALVVPLVTEQVESGAQEAAQVFDLLVAAPGSRTQAVMSSLFYLDIPTGNMPLNVYTGLLNDPATARAVPLGFGDNYLGFPVVGTSGQFFDQRLSPADAPYFRVADGRQFAAPFEAVLGAAAAQQTGLHPGDTFVGAHGLDGAAALEDEWAEELDADELDADELDADELYADDTEGAEHDHAEHKHAEHESADHAEHGHDHEHEHSTAEASAHAEANTHVEGMHAGHAHDHPYTVVGVLAPTGGPADRAVLTPIETLWAAHGQAGHDREVTAVLYAAEDLAGIYAVAGRINAGSEAMAVFPGEVFAQASDTLGQGQAAYAALSLLVLGIAALTVWLSVYTSGLERQRSVALLRALGAGRGTVFALVLLETLLTVTLGVLLGIALAWLLAGLGGRVLGGQLGFTLPPPQLTWALAGRALALIPLGALAALPPAVVAARRSPLDYL